MKIKLGKGFALTVIAVTASRLSTIPDIAESQDSMFAYMLSVFIIAFLIMSRRKYEIYNRNN